MSAHLSRVGFSDRNLFVVGRRRRCCRLPCKVVTFSSSSSKQLDQSQLNIAPSILGEKGIQVSSKEWTNFFPRGVNKEMAKIH